MQTRKLLISFLLIGCLLAVPLTAGAAGTQSSGTAVVKVAYNKKLKRRILVTGGGMTLYMFVQDSRNNPTCFDDDTYHCSKAWPPYRSTARPVAKPGVNALWLRTVTRTDGDPQVTYRGHPLYRDAGSAGLGLHADRRPGQINGQGYGGLWWVVSPKGRAITII